MENLQFPTTAGAIALSLGAELVGDPGAQVERLAALDGAGPGTLSYFANRKYAEVLQKARDAVIFTSRELMRSELPLTYILVSDPQVTFAGLAKAMTERRHDSGVSPLASVHPTARLGKNVHVGAFSVVGEGAIVGEETRIFGHAFVGAGVVIGRDCEIHPQVTLWDHVRLGDRVKIFAGTVIGSDGFGFVEKEGRHLEIPQIGTVVIEDDVRIGANCAVDRATLGETRVGAGTKMDNFVHIAHNCRIGRDVILCAAAAIAGSVVIEDGVMCGGQVGIAPGTILGKGARIGAQSGASTNIGAGETYWGSPAFPMREALRCVKYFRKLPEIWNRLRALEERQNPK